MLHAEPKKGAGTVLDAIAGDMANQWLNALGRPAGQDGPHLRRLREAGHWRRYDRRCPD